MGKDVKIEVEKRDLHAATVEAEKIKAEKVLEDLMRIDDVPVMERQIYSMDEQENTFLSEDVVNGSSSIFYNDDNFPPLPDFPCMSSSSSSSSLPPPTNPLFTPSAVSTVSTAPTATPSSSASSSSSVSWAVLKSDSEDYHHNRNLHSGVVVNNINIPPIPGSLSATSSMEVFSASQNGIPGMGVMDDFGCLDLQIDDDDDIWDPSSIFLNENNTSQQDDEQNMFVPEEHHEREYVKEENNNNFEDNSNGFDFFQGSGELSEIFLDWLKQNKDFISAEDMRNITLKKSTIESAMKRLGTSTEGKKHLLKLILDWVESCKLQKKKLDSENSLPNSYQQQQQNQFQDSVQNPNPDPNACFSQSPWFMAPNGPSAFGTNSVAPPHQLNVFQPGMGYMGDPSYAFNSYMPHQQAEFQQMHNSAHQCWQQPSHMPAQLVMAPPSQYVPFPPDNNTGVSPATPPQVGMYGNSGSHQYHPYQGFDGNTDGLVRMGSSATKEARKKRMARQRRLSTHHFRHHNPLTNHHENNIQNQIQVNGQQHVIRMNNNDGGLNCSSSAGVTAAAAPPPVGNWVYWPPSTAVTSASTSTNVTMVPVGNPSQTIPIDRTPVQRSVPPVPPATDRRQGWRTEKNLKFLLQKVLKQSDVGNLGRIVLPKKEAELHLPELESRDGIGIALEDIGTSRVWNMRYRFWPNNKSRMYLLENTGEFVRTNGLREGDFIVLYSDTKCGKYMIRGVKVRQQGLQPESNKKPIKRNIRKIAPAFNGAPHCAAITQAVK